MKSHVIQAYGVPGESPQNLSWALEALGISHSLHGVGLTRHTLPEIRHISKEQPYWVCILNGIDALRTPMPKKPYILFICESFARLQTCNVGLLPFSSYDKPYSWNLTDALLYASHNPIKDGWQLVEKKPSIEDYVSQASKPSFLNFIQTAQYKITPYALMKEVGALCISYLNGTTSQRELFQRLKASHKFERLLAIMKLEGSLNLRKAVARFKETQDVESVAMEFGVEQFEITYVIKSGAKHKEK